MPRPLLCRFLMPALCVATLALSSAPGRAAVPQSMSYQGVLTDLGGTPLPDGPHDLVFALYAAADGGAPLWSESQPAVTLTKGVFSVTLGSVTPLAIPFDQQYWLGVSVDAGAELVPRITLASAPYALSVQTPLPAGSLYSNSLIDAPGIAQNHANTGNIGPAGISNYQNAIAVTITTPAPGYIVVTADATLVVLCYTWIGVQISETSNGPQDDLHYVLAGGESPSNNEGYLPVSTHRTYYKAAGTYTFYFQGRNPNYTSCIPYMFNPTITAMYVPTSYGAVVSAPSVTGPSAAARIADPGAAPPAPLATGALVDLRELELRAARTEADAQRARADLAQAKLKAEQAGPRKGGGK